MAQVYKVAAILAARAAGASPEMDRVAERVAALAIGFAAGHRLTGEYVRGIGTAEIRGRRGVMDRIAYVDHPAATFIEWGHMTARPMVGAEVVEGPQRWVEGLHIFGRAAARAGD